MEEVKSYSKPIHGLFRFLPDALVPYAELMRLDRLSGFWAFYWHYAIGLGSAINMPLFSSDIDLKAIVLLAAHLGLWKTVFRGIACTWNDNIDQDLDRQVARCLVRPIPRGAITMMQAFLHCRTDCRRSLHLVPLRQPGVDPCHHRRRYFVHLPIPEALYELFPSRAGIWIVLCYISGDCDGREGSVKSSVGPVV